MRPALALTLAASLLCLTATTQAANLRFLDKSVVSELTEAEVGSLRQTISDTLHKAPDQKTIHWQSASRDIRGRVKIRFSYLYNETHCRSAIFDLRDADEHRDFYHFDLCESDAGWKITSTPTHYFSDDDWSSLETTIGQALDNSKDYEESSWQSGDGKSSSQGLITPVGSYQREGKNCRTLDIALSHSEGAHSRSELNFCKTDKGWEREKPSLD